MCLAVIIINMFQFYSYFILLKLNKKKHKCFDLKTSFEKKINKNNTQYYYLYDECYFVRLYKCPIKTE